MERNERTKTYQTPIKVHALNGAFTIYVEFPLPNGETIRPKDGASLRALVAQLTGETVRALYRARPEVGSDESAIAIADTDEDLPRVVYVETTASSDKDARGSMVSDRSS
jgi:hypothetical protein